MKLYTYTNKMFYVHGHTCLANEINFMNKGYFK